MPAAEKPIFIEQGATFTLPFAWHQAGPEVNGVPTVGDPHDITGWSARMQIRKTLKAPSTLRLSSETVDSVTPRITLTGPTGRVVIKLPPEDTDLLTSTAYVYDLELVDLVGDVYRLLKGPVEVDLNVTRVDP